MLEKRTETDVLTTHAIALSRPCIAHEQREAFSRHTQLSSHACALHMNNRNHSQNVLDLFFYTTA